MLAVVSSTKAEVMQSIWFAVILSVCVQDYRKSN